MTVSRLHLLLGACLLSTFALTTMLPQAHAQNTPPAESRPTETPDLTFGFQVLHSLLESRGLQTTTDLRAIGNNPTRSVIVLLGDVNQNDLLTRARLRSFIAGGGCVLLATDQAVWADKLCVIQRGPVLVDSEFAYQNYVDCPQVTQIDFSHPLTSGVSQLIANRCGSLVTLFSSEGRWQTLAELPVADQEGQPRKLLAVMQSRDNRRGRLVALADHSMLINGMVLHGDNSRFMLNLTNWLSRDSRTQLFIAVDGLPLTATGQPSALPDELPPLPMPEELPKIDIEDLNDLPRDMWLPFANQLLLSMEDANIHNELLARRPRELSNRLYRRLLYFAVGLIVLLLIARQLIRRAQRVDRPVESRSQSLLASRVEQYQRTGQLTAAMQALAVDLLRTHTGSSQQADWQRAIAGLRIDASWFSRWRIKRALRDLTSIATRGATANALPPAEFRWLSRRIAEIQSLQQQHRLHWPSL